MTEQTTSACRAVAHDTFSIERHYPISVDRVFDAWSNPKNKCAWFAADDASRTDSALTMDFRTGGAERYSAVPADGGPALVYDARYIDIVDNARIIYAYDMHLGAKRISASLATVQFATDGDGTRLTFTEQGAYLDGHDNPAARERGTEALLDALSHLLSGEAAQ